MQRLSHLPVSPHCSPLGYTFLHLIQAGETLSHIIQRYYGHKTPSELSRAIFEIKNDNPGLKNENLLPTGSGLLLRQPLGSGPTPPGLIEDVRQANQILRAMGPNQKRLVEKHGSVLKEIAPYVGVSKKLVGGFGKNLSKGEAHIQLIIDKYLDYKQGKVSRSTYYAFRKAQLLKYSKDMDVLHKTLIGAKNPSQHFRISGKTARQVNRILATSKDLSGVQPLSRQMARMSKVANALGKTGTVLSVVSLGTKAHNIYEACGRNDFGEVLGKEVGGYIGGTAATLVLGAVLATGGVAGIALVVFVAAGSIAAGIGGGMAGQELMKEVRCQDVKMLWSKAIPEG